LVIEYTQGKLDNLLEILKATYEIDDDRTIDLITEEKLNEIRIAYYGLMKKWNALPERETMTLIFED
jgi:hypothetical protein